MGCRLRRKCLRETPRKGGRPGCPGRNQMIVSRTIGLFFVLVLSAGCGSDKSDANNSSAGNAGNGGVAGTSAGASGSAGASEVGGSHSGGGSPAGAGVEQTGSELTYYADVAPILE